MPNVFDQFDDIKPQSGTNVFDQFDDVQITAEDRQQRIAVLEGESAALRASDPSILKDVIGRTVGDIAGAAFEVPLSVGLGLSGEVSSGLAGLSGMAAGLVPGGESPLEKGARFAKGTREAFEFEPVTRGGQTGTELLGRVAASAGRALGTLPSAMAAFPPSAMAAFPMQELDSRQLDGSMPTHAERLEKLKRILDEGVLKSAGNSVLDLTGSPLLATVAEVAPTAGAMLLGARSPFRGVDVNTPVPTRVSQGQPQVSVGRPALDRPVDFTPAPAISSEQIVADLRRGRTDKVAEAVVPDVETVEAARRLGVDLNPEHYSTNSAFQDVARALKTRPGSTLQAVEVRALSDLSKRADDLVQSNQGLLDKAQFSQEIGSEITTLIDDLRISATEAYSGVSAAIPRATRVDTDLITNFVDNKLTELGGDRRLLSPIERQLEKLNRTDADGNPISPTYAGIDRVRRNIGEGFNRRGPFADSAQAELSEVYGLLSDVQQGVAESFRVGALYTGARDLVTRRKGLEDNAVQLFGRNMQGSIVPRLRAAATGVVKGDVSKLNELLRALPESRRGEAAATVLGYIFSGGSRRGGELSTGFVSSFNALNRNRAAKNVLFENLPASARQRFDDIGRVMTGIVQANRKPLANPSGSAGPIVRALGDLSAFEKIYEGGKRIAISEAASSVVGAPGLGTAGALGSIFSKPRTPVIVAADEMIASPAFSRAIDEAVGGNTIRANQIIDNSPKYKRWLASLNPENRAQLARVGFIAWLADEPQQQPDQQSTP